MTGQSDGRTEKLTPGCNLQVLVTVAVAWVSRAAEVPPIGITEATMWTACLKQSSLGWESASSAREDCLVRSLGSAQATVKRPDASRVGFGPEMELGRPGWWKTTAPALRGRATFRTAGRGES